MGKSKYRIERDSMGEVRVPVDRLYGPQTTRALANFSIQSTPMPYHFIDTLLVIKAAAATANMELGELPHELGNHILSGIQELRARKAKVEFPVPIYQTGSGTSTNMNVNEVVTGILLEKGINVSPNDHVNLGQSSNDVIPATIQLSASLLLRDQLIPAIESLSQHISLFQKKWGHLVKTGRTHLMDAVPIRFGDELGGWLAQLDESRERIEDGLKRLNRLPLGGTAVGSGLNSHPDFGRLVISILSEELQLDLHPAPSKFKNISSLDSVVEMSGHLKSCGLALHKIADDLRWMNSGPLTGLGEIQLPALQPGSSIMPAKVNPVIPEAVCMAVAQVIGHDAAISFCGCRGNFQLNTMLPLVGANLLDSIELISGSARDLGEKAISGTKVIPERFLAPLTKNPILVTSLVPRIGYLKSAEIGKKAIAENRTVFEIALRETDIPEDELKDLLDPARLADNRLQ